MGPFSYTGSFSRIPELEKLDSIQSRIIKAAMASFERNRDPAVAYANPELVERDGSWFFEWKPVGFVRHD